MEQLTMLYSVPFVGDVEFFLSSFIFR